MKIEAVWPSIEAEREPGPIRTRREIVPGVYGHIHVGGRDAASLTRALITMHSFAPMIPMKSSELREAAHLFNQLAEVLEENQ